MFNQRMQNYETKGYANDIKQEWFVLTTFFK